MFSLRAQSSFQTRAIQLSWVKEVALLMLTPRQNIQTSTSMCQVNIFTVCLLHLQISKKSDRFSYLIDAKNTKICKRLKWNEMFLRHSKKRTAGYARMAGSAKDQEIAEGNCGFLNSSKNTKKSL